MTIVSRVTAFALRLAPVAGAALVLAGCGSPPQPLPTAPPQAYGPAPSGSPGGLPSGPPTAGVPTAGGYPQYPTYPTNPTYPATTSPPPPTGPPPAPRCTAGPSAAQVIAAVKTDIPAEQTPEVKKGPFCAGSWQFTVIGEAGKTLDQVDPLLVVTTGKPAALKVEEAGADVCSDHVQSASPPGIRVLACGP